MYQRIIFPSSLVDCPLKSRKQNTSKKANPPITSSSAVPFHIKMSLLWKPPVRLHRSLRLPQRSKSVPPLQTRDHKRVCGGVEFAGKQRRRLDDPWQVSWPIYTAFLDITACKKKPQDLAAFVPLSVSIHIKKVTASLRSSGRCLRSPGVQITYDFHDCSGGLLCWVLNL